MKNLIIAILVAVMGWQVLPAICFSAELAPVREWVKTWDGVGNDRGNDIAVYTTAKGVEYIYVTGYSTPATIDCLTIKYNSNGDTLWQKGYDRAVQDDMGNAIAIDNNGFIYVGGKAQIGANDDVLLIKYDTNGDTVWPIKFHDVGGNDNYADGIAVDNNGFIYLAGYYDGATDDILTIKCDSNGNTVWVKVDDSSGNKDWGHAIAVDEGNYVYVTGEANDNYITTKLNKSDSSAVWTKIYDSGGSDIAYGIALDRGPGGSGNVYVTGISNNDIFIIKYDSNGDTVWHDRYDRGGNNAAGFDIAVDSNGYVYIAGYANNGADNDFVTIKYTSSGSRVWVQTYDSNGNDEARGIAVSDEGNIYITGFNGNNEVVTIKYSQRPVPGMTKPAYEGEVKIGSTGGKGIVYPGEQAVIAFKPTESGKVTVKIYTLNGLLVRDDLSRDVTNIEDSANNIIQWACDNKSGGKVASGIYLVRVEGPGIKVTKKVAILR